MKRAGAPAACGLWIFVAGHLSPWNEIPTQDYLHVMPFMPWLPRDCSCPNSPKQGMILFAAGRRRRGPCWSCTQSGSPRAVLCSSCKAERLQPGWHKMHMRFWCWFHACACWETRCSYFGPCLSYCGFNFHSENYSFSFEPKYPQYHCPANCRKPQVVRRDISPPIPPLPNMQPAEPVCFKPSCRRHLSFQKMTPVVTQIYKCLLPML